MADTEHKARAAAQAVAGDTSFSFVLWLVLGVAVGIITLEIARKLYVEKPYLRYPAMGVFAGVCIGIAWLVHLGAPAAIPLPWAFVGALVAIALGYERLNAALAKALDAAEKRAIELLNAAGGK